MQVVAARSSLLSNYEVLKLLGEHDIVHNSHARTALVKKEDTGAKQPTNTPVTYSQNVRTIEFEAIAHLTTSPLPTAKQDEESIVKLLKQLSGYNLTKLEKLQIVNLLPESLVELYVIVEDLEERFSEDDMLQIIQITAASTKTPMTANISRAKFHNSVIAESAVEQLDDIGLDVWTGDMGEDMLLDGPLYDLVGDVDEDSEG